MRRVLPFALIGFLFVVPVRAQNDPIPTVEDFTLRITEALRATDPTAAGLFAQANAARGANLPARAEQLYRQVLELQPNFHHAMRRLADVLLAQGRAEEAIAAAREAFALEKSPENRLVLIDSLSSDPSRAAASFEAAARHAEELLLVPDFDRQRGVTVCAAAARMENESLLARGVGYLQAGAPGDVDTHHYAWMLATSRGDWKAAYAALERAHAAGLADATYRSLRSVTDARRPAFDRYRGVAIAVAGGWGTAFLLLTLAGAALSALAANAARHFIPSRFGEVFGLGAFVRCAYRVVLWLSCAFYYVSIPLLLLASLAIGGGGLWVLFRLGHVPLPALVVVGALMLVSIGAVLRSVFARGRDAEPGERLDTSRHPRLLALLHEVARQVGTRPVDNVYLTPGTDFAVMERGGVVHQLVGRTERCLILGVGVLDGLRVGPFKAILAHEYGHFSNRDTAGGGFALAVRRSILKTAVALTAGGAAAWYNPLWVFLGAFHRIFLGISQGASRLQEVLADRWAAFAYGSEAFEAGLRHVIRSNLRFDRHVNLVLRRAIESRTPLASVYRMPAVDDVSEATLSEAVAKAIDHEPSPYDSHPCPQDRIEMTRTLYATPEGDLSNAHVETWTLFEDRAAIERKMTAAIVRDVEEMHGVSIAVA